MSTANLEQISALRRDIVVRWLVPERVIFATGVGAASPTAREWMNARIVFLMHSCSTPHVHLVCDMRHMSGVPLSSLLSPVLRHPRRGWFITIGRPDATSLTVVMRWLARLTVAKYHTCSDLEEALTLLRQVDPTLPDLPSHQETFLAESS